MRSPSSFLQALAAPSLSRGQATVEAALLIPTMMLCILVALEPCILLFDRAVMIVAASEGCRICHGMEPNQDSAAFDCVSRRLDAIPDVSVFHDGLWDIEFEGDETTRGVAVRISHTVRLLPLIGAAASTLGFSSDGEYTQRVEVSLDSYDSWTADCELGLDPEAWIQRWEDGI